MRNSASHIITLFLVLASSQMAVSDDPADIRTALSVVFAEDHVDECAFDVHQKAKRLPPEQRLLFLARWVLPNENHPTLRLTAGFSPTDAGPLSSNAEAATRSSTQSIPKEDGLQSKQTAIENGGVTVSPFFDLIDTAVETNQLSDIRRRITAWAPDSQLSVRAAAEAETNRQIALTLLEVADQRIEQAETHMNHVVNSVFRNLRPQLLRPVNSDDENTTRENDRENGVAGDNVLSDEEAISNDVVAELFEPSDAMLLLLTRTAEIAQLREMAGMLLARCEKWGNSNYNRNVRQQHVMALFHRMGAIDGGRVAGATVADSVSAMNHWKAVSQTTAVSRGTGRPNSKWMFYPGHVELVSPHERDFLYFNVPMRGN